MTRGRSGLNVAGSVFQGAFQLTVNWRGDIRPNARASFHRRRRSAVNGLSCVARSARDENGRGSLVVGLGSVV